MNEAAVPQVRKSITNITENEQKVRCKSGRSLDLGPGQTLNLKLDEVEESELDHLAREGRIAVEPYEERFVIGNRTPYRIAIRKQPGAGEQEKLVIPAFGLREISKAERERYDTDAWEKANLIHVRSTDRRNLAPAGNMLALFFTLVITALLVGAGASAGLRAWIKDNNVTGWTASSSKYVWPVVTLIFLVVFIGKVFGRKRELLRQVSQWMLALITFVVAIGLPGWIIFHRPGTSTWEFSFSLMAFIQFAFVGIASVTPASLFFLFDRQRVRTLRESFFREVTRLDPQIKSLDDAESIYGARVDEAYGVPLAESYETQPDPDSTEPNLALSSRLVSTKRLSVVIATILVTAGWLLVLRAGKQLNESSTVLDYLQPNCTLVSFGFLGCYFFGLNMLFRRYARSDLKPKAYSHLVVRILTVSTICLVLMAFPIASLPGLDEGPSETSHQTGTNMVTGGTTATAPSTPKASTALTASDMVTEWMLLFAFIIGIFPETGVNFIAETLRARKMFRNAIPSLREKLTLTALEGISLYDRTRLVEEGVENIENLAHHDLIDLIIYTRIPVPRLIDWVDQAILYLHLGIEDLSDTAQEETSGATSDLELGRQHLRLLKQNGIRNATGLERALSLAPDRKQLLTLIPGAGANPPPLEVIANAISGEQWMSNIRWWRRMGDQKDVTLELKDFQIEMGAGGSTAINL